MERLLTGYRQFRASLSPEQSELFARLAQGQSPRAMVVACVDSRVDPQMIFAAAPGELLVVRNIANLVPPYRPNADYHGTSAALEFGVRSVKVEHIIVLGHAQCGGIGALLNGAGETGSDFVASWMSIAAVARVRALAVGEAERQRHCELEGIKLSLENLMTFPWIEERVTAGKLQLHGLFFDIPNGALLRFEKGGFRPVPA